MTFRILARTLFHLGSELISSDHVALYELVKNAFDARSKRVTIDVVIRIKHNDIEQLTERLDSEYEMNAFRQDLLAAVDRTAPDAQELHHSISVATTRNDFVQALAEANYIVVSDTGEGMSLNILNNVYLTIGTRSRQISREGAIEDGRPVLGEKGLGRLSTMRLGKHLHVESTMAGEIYWNILDIDWSQLSYDSDELLEAFSVEPKRGGLKDDPTVSGTRVRISGLNSDWSVVKLKNLAREEFSKFTDPFALGSVFPVFLSYNGDPIPVPRFDKLLLEHAHATVRAWFECISEDNMRLVGTVYYKQRQLNFAVEGAHLTSVVDSSPRVLKSLGPFSLELYWYNRRLLRATKGISDKELALKLIKAWGGGVMVYRDGFRVLPYGGPDDDWLDLDRKAFASSGYKVNRAQIVARVSITSRDNPALTDQTNREGLRDSPERHALEKLLQHVLQTQFRTFLDNVDKEIQAQEPVAIEDIEERVRTEEQRVKDSLAELVRRVPEMQQHKPLLGSINAALAQIDNLIQQVHDMAAAYEAGRGELLNLAGIGLTVETLGHELNRSVHYALLTLADSPKEQLPRQVDALVRTLEAQFKTLQKRLQLLDPLSTAARQHKEVFDVVALIRDVVDVHADRCVREGINCTVAADSPTSSSHTVQIKAVKGMIVQVVENLLVNSIFWLRQQRTLNPEHNGWIKVIVDPTTKELRVSDNGPGVQPELRERVFEAFFTTKPVGEGKGLGLYVAREIARYHGADLYLANEPSGPDKTLHTFVLTLGGMMT